MGSSRGQAAADRAQSAADRAKQAGQRAADLRRRQEAGGVPWTSETAHVANEQSQALAAVARAFAVAAYSRAADAHRTAALVAEARGDPVRAQEHRKLAAADDSRAAALAQVQT